MAIDPVCGMKVDPAKAAGEFEHKGTKYYFCSKHCLHSFRSDPGRYLAAAAPMPPAAKPAPAPKPGAPAAQYTCPRGSTSTSPGSMPRPAACVLSSMLRIEVNMADHAQHNHSSGSGGYGRWVFWGFLLVAGYFLITEHWAHTIQYLPFALLLACPLLHMFHGHGGHGGHGKDDKEDGGR